MVPLSAVAPLAVLLGTGLGFGAWLLVSAAPRVGRARLVERVAPYVTDVSAAARAMTVARRSDPAAVFGTMLAPVIMRSRAIVGTWIGGDDTIVRRLRQAGSISSVERFRASQLAWAAVGFAVASALMVFAPTLSAMPLAARIALPVIAALAGGLLRDTMLQRTAKRRLQRVSDELPTVLEFLTLSLTAGESMLDAIRRIARSSSGELARELAGVSSAVATGVPLSQALSDLREALDHHEFSRAIDQVLGALERGAPLAEVLRAQAGDARESAKRRIIELAGQKEILMLVPLVFLILPITIAFALFPGLLVLQTGF